MYFFDFGVRGAGCKFQRTIYHSRTNKNSPNNYAFYIINYELFMSFLCVRIRLLLFRFRLNRPLAAIPLWRAER